MLLHKLVWYRMGAEVSDRQIQDIRGLLAAQGAIPEQQFLSRWSTPLEVDDLLRRLQADRS
jgi:hypothetical protein